MRFVSTQININMNKKKVAKAVANKGIRVGKLKLLKHHKSNLRRAIK